MTGVPLFVLKFCANKRFLFCLGIGRGYFCEILIPLKNILYIVFLFCVITGQLSAQHTISFDKPSYDIDIQTLDKITVSYTIVTTVVTRDNDYNLGVRLVENPNENYAGVSIKASSRYTGIQSNPAFIVNLNGNQFYSEDIGVSGNSYGSGVHTVQIEVTIDPMLASSRDITATLNFYRISVDNRGVRTEANSSNHTLSLNVAEIVEYTIEKLAVEPYRFENFSTLIDGIPQDLFMVHVKTNKSSTLNSALSIHAQFDEEVTFGAGESILYMREKEKGAYIPILTQSSDSPIINFSSESSSVSHTFELNVKPQFLIAPDVYNCRVFYTVTQP